VTEPEADAAISTAAELLFRAISDAADSAKISVLVLRNGAGENVEILYLNRAVEELLGYERREIVARGFWSFVPSAEVEWVRQVQEARRRGEEVPRTYKTSLVHRSGRAILVEAAVGTVTLAGNPAMVLFLVDVTARRAAEEALRYSQTLFQQVVTHAPDGIYILRWPIVLYANPAGARILELERPEDATGFNITERMSRDEVAVAVERMRHARQEGSLLEPFQYRISNPSGRAFAVEVSSIPIEFDGGLATLAFVRDVTERNALLMRLQEAEKLTAVHALAAGVAHEINNPLAYVLLNLEFLERELPELGCDALRTQALQRRLADTRHGAERVKNIVRDLQALTRKDEGIRGPVELDQVIDHALSRAERVLPKNTRVVREFAAVPCVLGNATRIEQLFWNLLINAAHALDSDSHATHTLRVTLALNQDGRILAEVQDDGCGMTDQVVRRAFDPFFTTKPQGVGAGLGLAICKRIVDDLGGQISLETRPDSGTTVRVLLPSCSASNDAATTSGKRRGKVLVVDDERAVAESLHHALRDEHDVDIATSAREARTAFAGAKDYDVVLCDLAMPVESGAELYASACAQYPALAQRFVFMTGGAFTQKAVDFLRENQRPHIDKPFSLDRLRTLVEQFVARHNA
jgi:PAS domain S-box-containing protein